MTFAATPARPGLRLAAPPVWATALAFAGLHLALAASLWLVQDEAYYALWATHLAPAYYDHPPMIALWIRIGTALFGHTPLGVRAVSVLGFALVTPVTAAIARSVGGEVETGRWAALIFNCMATPFALGFTATPDAPSTLFWALATWAILRAPEERTGRLWLLAGPLLALGVLSKLSNLFLCVGLALWLIGSRRGRAELRRPALWAGAALCVTLLLPFLVWSADHQWLGLARQFGRLSKPPLPRLHTGDFLAMSVVSITPLLFWRAVCAGRNLAGPAGRLMWLGAPFLLYLAVHSLHSQVQANWIVPLFPGIAVLAALREQASRPAAAAIGLTLSSMALALALWPGAPVFPGDNPANQTKGWAVLSRQIGDLAAAGKARWIATTDYGTTGELAFALPGMKVWDVAERERWGFRGAFPAALCHAGGLLVQALPSAQSPRDLFAERGATRHLARRSAGAVLRQYAVTPVAGLKDGRCAE